jgi:hypothetical protein
MNFDAVDFLMEKTSPDQLNNMLLQPDKSGILIDLIISSTRRDSLNVYGLFMKLYIKGQEIGLTKKEMLGYGNYHILTECSAAGNRPLFRFIYAEINSLSDLDSKPKLQESFEWAMRRHKSEMVESICALSSSLKQIEMFKT